MRRRPLARAAMVGGAAYYAGKHRQDTVYREDEQEARLQQLEAQQYPSAPAAPAGGAPPIEQLKELAQLKTRSGTRRTRFRTAPLRGIALIEHRRAIPLRDAIVRAGGILLIDEWIHATDLVAAGLKLEETAAPTR